MLVSIVSNRMEDKMFGGRNCTLVFRNGLASGTDYAIIDPYARSGTTPGSGSPA